MNSKLILRQIRQYLSLREGECHTCKDAVFMCSSCATAEQSASANIGRSTNWCAQMVMVKEKMNEKTRIGVDF